MVCRQCPYGHGPHFGTLLYRLLRRRRVLADLLLFYIPLRSLDHMLVIRFLAPLLRIGDYYACDEMQIGAYELFPVVEINRIL